MHNSRRDGGERRRRKREPRRRLSTLEQREWSVPRYVDQPIEPLDREGLERVHDAAMRILEEIGIDFLHPDAREILRRAGCDVETEGFRVRMDRGFVEEQIAKAPTRIVVTPRNPARAITWGDGCFTFGAVASPPNVSDIERGRRSGNRQDFADLVRLTQVFNCLHFHSGYPVEPVDIHASIRHLDALFDILTLSDKVCHAYSLGPERIEDAMEMVRIASGVSDDDFDEKARMYTNINSSSPLKHDWPMLDGAMRMAARN
ncbi:MAG: methyltransferase, partial [Proteobacteria bacterium]